MGQILLTNGYRGRLTGERFIAPGTYPQDDPALFGLGPQLVEAGAAQWVSGDDTVVAPSALIPKKPQRGKQIPQIKGG